MKIDELYRKETGENPWIEYAHVAGPTKEFWEWIELKFSLLKITDPKMPSSCLSCPIFTCWRPGSDSKECAEVWKKLMAQEKPRKEKWTKRLWDYFFSDTTAY